MYLYLWVVLQGTAGINQRPGLFSSFLDHRMQSWDAVVRGTGVLGPKDTKRQPNRITSRRSGTLTSEPGDP